jgi:hypothetical protein
MVHLPCAQLPVGAVIEQPGEGGYAYGRPEEGRSSGMQVLGLHAVQTNMVAVLVMVLSIPGGHKMAQDSVLSADHLCTTVVVSAGRVQYVPPAEQERYPAL